MISNTKEMPNDIIEYTFKFISPEVVNYNAGQFILVQIKKEPVMFRAYSISSYDKDGTSLSITVKKVAKGYGTTRIFDKFKVGDEIMLEGPMGRDLLVDEKAEKVLLIGGGIGITPFIPIVTDLVKNRSNVTDIKLLYGANKESEFIYNEEFEK
jgi:ferredoxin-NADP reductase